MFVHGALCFSYSGRCLMSSMIGGRSGNRQLRPAVQAAIYRRWEAGLLPKPEDLCLVHDISALRAAGVRSLKIEGRMKSPEYVAVVTNVYRKAIENRVTDDDVRRLRKSSAGAAALHGGTLGARQGGP